MSEHNLPKEYFDLLDYGNKKYEEAKKLYESGIIHVTKEIIEKTLVSMDEYYNNNNHQQV